LGQAEEHERDRRLTRLGSVTVLYFAGARDVVGKRRESIQLEGRATARELLDLIIREHPGLRIMRDSIRLSVNQEIVGLSSSVNEGDELGILPPVAGG
jgi:molybdopterin synthase catalytic subunit